MSTRATRLSSSFWSALRFNKPGPSSSVAATSSCAVTSVESELKAVLTKSFDNSTAEGARTARQFDHLATLVCSIISREHHEVLGQLQVRQP